MNNRPSWIPGTLTLFAAVVLCLISQTSSAVIRDGDIDPANLGNGDWIYYTSMATNKLGGNVSSVTNETSLMQFYKNHGIRYIVVKAATSNELFNGSYSFPQFNTNLCNVARANGIKIFGYNRSWGADIPGEIAVSDYVFNCGADGFVWDAEGEWESNRAWIGTNGPAKAWQLCSTVRSNWPNKFLAHSPFPIISLHSSFPYKEFGFWSDTVMPQIYPQNWTGVKSRPSGGINWTDVNWQNWQNNLYTLPVTNIGGVTVNWTNSIKPLAPVNHVYGPNPPNTGVTAIAPEFVMEFIDYLVADPHCVTAGGYKGANFWRADLHGSQQWTNIKASTIGDFSGVVNNIVIDNPTALKVGTWTHVRVFYNGTYYGATGADFNSFGTNYWVKSVGTGAAYVEYRPNVITAGDYDIYQWHPVRSDASAGVPFIINYNGGSTTVNANQTTNGGKWSFVGRFPFAAGTSGTVRVTDTVSDGGVVLVDGLKMVYVPAAGAPPAAPSGLTATAVSSSQINLAWTDNSNDENNFLIERSTDGVNFTQIASVGANITAFSNAGLAANTTYHYRVRASNSSGSSAYSNTASATTQAALPPAAPSALTATAVSTSQINLTWADNSSDEDNFIVARSTTSGGPYTDIATLAANTTSYNNTGLSAATTYYYVVRAVNVNGASANSNQASATTLQNPPAAPSGLAATTVSQTQINLSWTDNSANETSFIVARSTTSGGPYTDITTLGANVTSYNNTGLSANTTYFYVVRASNSGGSSANSAQASATTLPNPPAAPSGLTAIPASSSQINLSWTDNSSNEANFILARSTTAGGPYTDIATLAANTTSYSDTGLAAATTYYYIVRATNTGGSSANSNEANATTTGVPNAPSGLNATAVRATRINLAWTDNSTDELNFIVARSTTAGGPYTDIATLGANVTSYNSIGLTANTTYYYVVRASNAAGSSVNSNEDSATTYETDLLIDNPSATVVGVWSTGTSAVDKYGTNYRFISSGTGGNYLQYTPWIATAGVYEVFEWHSQGANRPTNAPFVINYNGGSQTVEMNQEINGGQWNSLGSFNFATSGGYVRITDGFVDPGVVIADAIQLVYVPPPAAPSGLTATAVSTSQINLGWTDNSSNEDNMIVARSTTAGGPYTDIAFMSANSTSFSDTGLAANTTYYYVVRASNGSGSSANSNEASATTFPNQTTVTFTSVAAHDGYILESGETTGVGGTMSSTANGNAALRVGDDITDKQYKAIVSFDTSSLPDGATIVSATLKLKRGSVTGTNPFTTHGTCHADIKNGGFGGATTLAIGDFQAAADAIQVAAMSNPTSNGALSTGTVNASGRGFVNKTGHTQFRVYLSIDDNDDIGNDYTGLYSGENATAGNRPVLEIVYE